MAQLVKLLDYITRYETKAFHYPTQFIRLKQEHWEQLMRQWEEENDLELLEQIPNDEKKTGSETKEEKKKFLWKFFKKKEYAYIGRKIYSNIANDEKAVNYVFFKSINAFSIKVGDIDNYSYFFYRKKLYV